MADGIFVGGGGADRRAAQHLLLGQGNRHGLIAGATGTGKTVTLQILAEGFSAAGVPVFVADVKGDLAGLAAPGSDATPLHPKLQSRAAQIGLDPYGYSGFPVTFWDIFGAQGHPVRATVSEMGPLLLARLLELTEAQEGVLNIAFRVADEEGLLLLDLKDLRALLGFVTEHAKSLAPRFGAIPTASAGTIQRRLLVLENQGAAGFFGEPALTLSDMIATEPDGRGRINILAADRLMGAPRLYATMLLWILSELFETLPEVGNPEKPTFVFFFDEAHLLFDAAPKALVDKVEQVARLIRSKGVGVYFISQNPDDVPDDVLGQLGNRVQHALRAFTPRDQKALAAAAETFRTNPAFDTAEAIRALGTGEALVSLLDEKGVPGIVERTLIRPPSSRIGPLLPEERARILAASPLGGRYGAAIDRDSAFEVLAARAASASAPEAAPDVPSPDLRGPQTAKAGTGAGTGTRWGAEPRPAPRRGGAGPDSLGETLAKTVIRSAGSQLTRSLLRGVLGSLLRGR